MAPAVVQSAKFQSATAAASATVTLSSAPVAGNVLVAFLSTETTTIWTPPSGFTQLFMADQSGNNDRLYCWTKTATGSEGTSLAFSADASHNRSVVVYEVQGVRPATSIVDYSTSLFANQSAGATINAPSVTATIDGELALAAWAANQGAGASDSVGAGWTLDQKADSAAHDLDTAHATSVTALGGSATPALTTGGTTWSRGIAATVLLVPSLALPNASSASEQALAGTLTSLISLTGDAEAEQELAAALHVELGLEAWAGDDDERLDVGLELTADLWLEPAEDLPPVGTHVSDLDIVNVDLPSPDLVNGVPLDWTPTVTREKWGRYQIIVGGTDVSHYRGKRTQVLSYASNEPFGDADATLYFPQITDFDDLDTLPWWQKGERVTIRRRHPDGSKTYVWTGLVASDEPGRTMQCLGTLYQLDLYIKPRSFLDEPRDVGHKIAKTINHRGKHHGLKATWCVPIDTGIDNREAGVGDRLLTSYIQNMLSTAITADGDQLTLTLQHPRTPVIKWKDLTTEDWSIVNGAPGVTASLARDYTQAPNVQYGTGSDRDCVWENRKFPHLRADDAPLYPLTLPAVFSPGGGTGGFAEFSDELRDAGYDLDSQDTYLSTDQEEVEEFQTDAGITVDGVVGPQTWAAAFQVGSNQGSLDNPWVKPLAMDNDVEPYLFNAQGARIGDNPGWDPSKLRIEKFTVFGDRVSKKVGKAAAKQMHVRDRQPGWSGTIALTTDPAEGSRRDIRAGQNILLKHHRGSNRLLHIARAEWDEGQGSMLLTVDTKARDLMNLAQIHQRNRDVANPAGQPKPGWRSGTQVSDRVQWACEDGSGKIPFHAQYASLWSVLRIPAGQDGVIAKVALAAGSGLTRGILNDLLTIPLPEAYHGYLIPGASKMAVAVFSREVTSNMLANLLGDPLQLDSNDDNPWDVNADKLTEWGCQYAAGGPDQAAGFYPRQDPGDGDTEHLSGRHVDAAGFPYESQHYPWLFVAIYCRDTCYVGGRLYPGAPA